MARRGKPPKVDSSERRGIQSAEVSADILEALASVPHAMTLSALSQAAAMPPSKVHRYLSSFIRKGLVRQDPKSGEYDFGKVAIKLGLAAISRFDVVERASDAMRHLTGLTGFTSSLAIWGQHGPTIVRWQRAPMQLLTSYGLGSVLPILPTASGRLFLAYLPREFTNDLLKKELAAARATDGSEEIPTTAGAVNALIRQIREDGFVCLGSVAIPGIQSAAAPIFDAQGDVSAVIVLGGTDKALSQPDSAPVQMLRVTCRELSLT